MERRLQIDWFEVFVMVPSDFDLECLSDHGMTFVEREYGTRIYARMAFIDAPELGGSFELRFMPKSSAILGVNGAHLKVDNKSCYYLNAAEFCFQVCCELGFEIQSVSRADICTDFLAFDSGIKPQSFIRRVLNGVYRRERNGLRKAIVQERWDEVTPNYVSWDDGAIKTRVYDKTLELIQVGLTEAHRKAYIVAQWVSLGLLPNPVALYDSAAPHVWRLEFQIQSSSRGWLRDDGSYLPFCIDTFCSPATLGELFGALVRTHFSFRVYKKGEGVSDCVSVDLVRSAQKFILHPVCSTSVADVTGKFALLKMLSAIDTWSRNPRFASLTDDLRALRESVRRLLDERAGATLSSDEVERMRKIIREAHIPFDDILAKI